MLRTAPSPTEKRAFTRYGDQPSDVAWKRTGERISTMFPSFLQSRWWDTSTPLYRREVTDLAGPWTSAEERRGLGIRLPDCKARPAVCITVMHLSRIHGLAAGNQLSRAALVIRISSGTEPRAHRLILEHALAARISHDTSEMQHFARELFLLARQCGAAGLAEEARTLFELARQASGAERGRGIDFLLYGSRGSR